MRQLLCRTLLTGVLAYVVVAAVAGTLSFIAPYLPQATPVVSVAELARLLRADLQRGGVLEYCPPFRCFHCDRGYRGFRVMTP